MKITQIKDLNKKFLLNYYLENFSDLIIKTFNFFN